MKKAVIKSILVFLLASSIFLTNCNSPMHPQNLGEYLQDLFVSNEIVLNEDDFFEPADDLYLAYAKMLDLIPSSYQSDERITEKTAEQISDDLLAVKDKLLLDGLYGMLICMSTFGRTALSIHS